MPSEINKKADNDQYSLGQNIRSTFPAYIGKKLSDFKRRTENAKSILVLTHDYPDPDCIASAMGLSHLLAFWGHKNPIISFGGFVGRAENRAMIRFLNISIIPYVLLEIKDYDCIILVDCFPGRNNVSLPVKIEIHAVIDHHRIDDSGNNAFFNDIRQNMGATSTIVTQYLIQAECPISPTLACGLFYGIMTDTGSMGRESTPEDLACYKYLFDIMDHRLLARIENPDRDIEFFRVLHRAAESMIIFDNAGYLPLGQVSSPDYIGEMVDIFHCLEKIEFTICTGIFKKNIFFSIRSKKQDEAGLLAETIARALNGGGGGHGKAGAGRIPFQPEQENEMIDKFIKVIKEVFNISQKESTVIVQTGARG
jgi:nanoRNase/pAp phosphatase (c-di-AMP/oligoRNAs hydrolase)